MQKVLTPKIKECPICGAEAKAISWNFDFNYQVMCDNNHTLTKECGSRHRAVCKWNNKVDKLTKKLDMHLTVCYTCCTFK